MKTIDLSGRRFDYLDGSESYLFFSSFREGGRFELKIWGATLMHQLGAAEYDVYVAAMSELVFENAVYVHLEYGIYANEQGTRFISSIDGSDNRMYLELGDREKAGECVQYDICGILGRNAGYGTLTVYCKGKVTLSYDESALVDGDEFCRAPEKYRLQ